MNQGGLDPIVDRGQECCEPVVNGGVRHCRTMNDTIERRRKHRSCWKSLQDDERVLEGSPLAPGNDPLAQLRRRAQEPREPLPPEITGRRAESPFSLDHNLFTQNLHCGRRGAAAGPSGVILDSERDAELLYQVLNYWPAHQHQMRF